jgi:acid stress-induced BolA-like protein IbaG/YrbA
MDALAIEHLIAQGLGSACSHVHVQGDGRHWQAVVVSSQFDGLLPVPRHRLVYAVLSPHMATDAIHAMSLKTYTPTEWQALSRV